MWPLKFSALRLSRSLAFPTWGLPSRLSLRRVRASAMWRSIPTILEKAAILVVRLARNHPLPDGNKRTAFLLTGLFLEANGSPLDGSLPDVDVPMVERIAAGEIDQEEVLAWLSERTA